MTRVRPSLHLRLSATVAVALVGAGLAGCSATNPITTQEPYAPSDGVRVGLGDLTAENLLVLTSGEGEPASLHGAVRNRGGEDLEVTFTLEDGTEVGTVEVAAGDGVLLGGTDGEQLLFTATDVPGSTTDLAISTAAGGAETVPVPVLDGTLPEYADEVPTEGPSTTPSAPTGVDPTLEPTPTPTATEG
ncbi:hypothetical protein [Cellulomonas cellasea]|uniref:DNA modification methylase n=1 Tax=Cellulomonas cellasea DSM 20118 TaxID=1408250 RepID=A0A0A0B848_9CELL|nr:hypothetical protein [Cellulomonas cellasea]KGM02393.1 hypothetical protein Q760_13740 [Cellulomonas cellasea DSM 20118]